MPPREVARFLFLKTLEGRSYDETYATLEALPELAHALGFERVPAASTVAALVSRIPVAWLEQIIRTTALRLGRGRVNAAGDSTGEGMRRYQRWFDVRHGRASLRHLFVKLHALVATRAERPYFLAARVTKGTRNDAPELGPLLDQLAPDLELGNVALDAGYQSRANATRVEERGGLPVLDLKANVTAKTLGHPAWARLVRRQRADGRAHRCRYRRRTVIEGVFGAFKARFGTEVRARRRHAQRVEILCRVGVWNVIAIAYDRMRRGWASNGRRRSLQSRSFDR